MTVAIGGIRWRIVETLMVRTERCISGGALLRIIMLSWEYPPRIIGGIARHVEELSWSLARLPGMEVHVVTCEFPGAPAEEIYNNVHIHRVAPHGDNHN